MPGAIPASRPVFRDAETCNGTADLGSLHRKLIQWVRWTYARDCFYKPCNMFPGDGDGAGSGNLGSFYVPQATTPAQRLVMNVFVELPSSGYWVDLSFVGTRGNEQTVHVDYAALGGATSGWYQFFFPCAPDSVVEVTANASMPSVVVRSICGWWEPLASGSGITVPSSALSFVSRTWAAQDRPDSTYFLRQLALLANRYGAKRPRMVVASAFGKPIGLGAGTYDVGRYRVFVGENTTSLVADVQHTVSTATDFTFKVYVDGALQATVASSAGAYETAVTVPITKGAARMIEVRLTATWAAGTRSVFSVAAYENAVATADLGLAAGDAAPGAFPALDANAGRGGAPIMATGPGGRAGILDALIWLYANRSWRLCFDDGTYMSSAYVVGGVHTSLGAVFPVIAGATTTLRMAVRQTLQPSDPRPPFGDALAHGGIYIGGVWVTHQMFDAPGPGAFGRWCAFSAAIGDGSYRLSSEEFTGASGGPYCTFTGLAVEVTATAP